MLPRLISFLFIFVISLSWFQAAGQSVASDPVYIKLRDKTVNTRNYRNALATVYQKKGYLLAFADSLAPDSISLYKGRLFTNVIIDWPAEGLNKALIQAKDLGTLGEQWLVTAENTGYPYAILKYQVADQTDSAVHIRVVADKGDLYQTDSLFYGEIELSDRFVRWCRGNLEGDIYNHRGMLNLLERLEYVDGIGCGPEPLLRIENAALKVYLPVYRVSRDHISGIVGLATQPDGRPVFTGELNARFYNMFRAGVHSSFEWRSFRARSQEMKIRGSLPFLLGTPFVTRFAISLEKFDTLYSNFSRGLELTVPIRRKQSLVIGTTITDRMRIWADKATVENFRRLPDNPAARNGYYYLGFEYRNLREGDLPVKGGGISLRGGAGVRRLLRDASLEGIRWTNAAGVVENIYDSLDRSGLLRTSNYRLDGSAFRFTRLGKMVVLKTAAEGHLYYAPTVYFNELERYGGIKNIRGFTEQSIFASEFVMGTLELRFQSGNAGFIGPFYHLGRFRDRSGLSSPGSGWLHGTGISAAIQTGSGVLHLAWALGKSGSQPLAFNQSRFHFGIATTF